MDTNNQLVGGNLEKSSKVYIGNLKEKRGGIKIIPGDLDDKIISKRNKILNHLDKVISGEKRLKEKNIKKYFQALGGKYVRNKICISGDEPNCQQGKYVSLGGAHKLLKLITKKKFDINNTLNTFKGSAPQLFEKLETKIKGGYKRIGYDESKGGIPKGTAIYGQVPDEAPTKKPEYKNYGVNDFMSDKAARNEIINYLKKVLRDDTMNINSFTMYFEALDARYQLNKKCSSGKTSDCNEAVADTKYLFKQLVNWMKSRDRNFDYNSLSDLVIVQNEPKIAELFEERVRAFRNGGNSDRYSEPREERYSESRRGGENTYSENRERHLDKFFEDRHRYSESRRGGNEERYSESIAPTERIRLSEARRGGEQFHAKVYPDEEPKCKNNIKELYNSYRNKDRFYTPETLVPLIREVYNALDDNVCVNIDIIRLANRIHKMAFDVESVNDDARHIYQQAFKTMKDGGNDRYSENRYVERGGNERYSENRYDDRYSESRRGGRNRYVDYYSDSMHGGALGEFRNEINRNLFNSELRDDILRLNLD